MITQAYISKSLTGLKFRKVYNLTKYNDSTKPLVIFGMYREQDYDTFMNHNSDVVLVWQGMDAKQIPENWIENLKTKPCKHYAISHWISRSLKKHDIRHTLLPVSATRPKLNIKPCGDAIYIYSSDLSKASAKYHGEHLIEQIRQKTKLEVIRATLKTYDKKELTKIYEKCFINLRLTKYDGCPNTNLEMGLMGRPSIFNGKIPHSIKWKGIDDICESIMNQFKKRHEDNSQIAKDIYKYMNISKSFLNL